MRTIRHINIEFLHEALLAKQCFFAFAVASEGRKIKIHLFLDLQEQTVLLAHTLDRRTARAEHRWWNYVILRTYHVLESVTPVVIVVIIPVHQVRASVGFGWFQIAVDVQQQFLEFHFHNLTNESHSLLCKRDWPNKWHFRQHNATQRKKTTHGSMQQEIQILLRGQPWPVNDAPCTTADSRMKVKSPPHTRPGSMVASKILLMPTPDPERDFFLNHIKTSCLHNTHYHRFFSFIHTRSLLTVADCWLS